MLPAPFPSAAPSSSTWAFCSFRNTSTGGAGEDSPLMGGGQGVPSPSRHLLFPAPRMASFPWPLALLRPSALSSTVTPSKGPFAQPKRDLCGSSIPFDFLLKKDNWSRGLVPPRLSSNMQGGAASFLAVGLAHSPLTPSPERKTDALVPFPG